MAVMVDEEEEHLRGRGRRKPLEKSSSAEEGSREEGSKLNLKSYSEKEDDGCRV